MRLGWYGTIANPDSRTHTRDIIDSSVADDLDDNDEVGGGVVLDKVKLSSQSPSPCTIANIDLVRWYELDFHNSMDNKQPNSS